MQQTTFDLAEWEQFAFEWRFRDPQWDRLASEFLALIHPLSQNKANEVYQTILALRLQGPYVVNTDKFHTLTNVSLIEKGEREDSQIANWFSEVPISPKEAIYCLWTHISPCVALVTQ